MKQFWLILIIFFCSCSAETENEKSSENELPLFDRAKNNSLELMNSLSSEKFMDFFPEKYFPDREYIGFVQFDLSSRCNPDKSKFEYYDHFTEIYHEKTDFDKVHFVYNASFDCGNLVFIWGYNLWKTDNTFELFTYKIDYQGFPSDIIDNIKKRRKEEGKAD